MSAVTRVLIVEDSEFDAAILERHLSRVPGIEVRHCENLSCCDTAASPDVAIVDLNLPDGRGAELADRWPGALVIVLSGAPTMDLYDVVKGTGCAALPKDSYGYAMVVSLVHSYQLTQTARGKDARLARLQEDPAHGDA